MTSAFEIASFCDVASQKSVDTVTSTRTAKEPGPSHVTVTSLETPYCNIAFVVMRRISITATPTSTTEKVEDTGEMSLAYYIVIIIIVVIAAMIAMKLIARKYLQGKTKDSNPTETKNGSDREKHLGNGILVTLRMKTLDSKRASSIYSGP